MLRGLYIFVHFENTSVRAYQKRGPKNAVILPAHEFLFAPNVIQPDDLTLVIREQGERQIIFVLKFVVRLHAVRTDSNYFYACRPEGPVVVTKTTGFFGSARRVVFWIEIQHQRLSLVGGQAVGFSILV